MNHPAPNNSDIINYANGHPHRHNQQQQQQQDTQHFYSKSYPTSFNNEIGNINRSEGVREPLNPVWNNTQPYQNPNKSAASMLMFPHDDDRSPLTYSLISSPANNTTNTTTPCTSSHNRNANNTTSSSIPQASTERSSCTNYMYPTSSNNNSNIQQQYPQRKQSSPPPHYPIRNNNQSVHDVAPSPIQRNTPSSNGSTINSQLLHDCRGVQINNYDIPSSNCQREDGKSFIQQPDQLVQTKQEFKTNITISSSSDIDFPNNMNNTNRVSTDHHQPTCIINNNNYNNNNNMNEFNNTRRTTSSSTYGYNNNNSTTLDQNMFNNSSSPPPSSMLQYYNSQQHHNNNNNSVSNIPNQKRISPTVNYESSSTGRIVDESASYHNGSRATTSLPQQQHAATSSHDNTHVLPYYNAHPSRHASPTSTTYQYSPHQQHQQQHVQQSPRSLPTDQPREYPSSYSDPVVSNSSQPPQYQPSLQKDNRSLDPSYSANGYHSQQQYQLTTQIILLAAIILDQI
ncbi:predicted protein [Naegleria gruberi]|uniref:Predicted protein n=1 Tax=Naegleria gruberi TaxID=5762 RepID=D2VYT4_NAEGR|nr:uncharacterized protein NAEGRDRAFT_53335 [Naegleria gruberi]EFC37964.1 predicted protein [Naegleria gruberi]|eukprot:XP_002670708.1 predicted protein [Naegleria gruberi strain NEG-M]